MGTLLSYHRMVKTAQFWKTGKPAEDVKTKLASNHHNTSKQTKLRATITPGTVVILLAGHHKGKGVPLRRVPQSYVIATSTKVNISKVKVPDTVNDAFFAKPKTKTKKNADTLLEGGAKAKESTLDESRKALQSQVDTALVAEISKTPLLKAYIGSKFSLKNGQKPHEMAF